VADAAATAGATALGWGAWKGLTHFFPALGEGMLGGLVSRIFPGMLISQGLEAAGLFTPPIPHFSGRIGYEQQAFGTAGMGGGMMTGMPFGQFFGADPSDPMEVSRLRRLRERSIRTEEMLPHTLDLDYGAMARRTAGLPALAPGFQFRGREIGGEISPPGEMLPPLNERGSRAGRAERAAAMTQQVTQQFNMPISVQGATIDQIIAKVGAMIRAAFSNALTHNSGQGGGTDQSPGTTGGGTTGYM
jgi:hypothetical protein